MAKGRRTKKQKMRAKRNYLIDISLNLQKTRIKPLVKGQTRLGDKREISRMKERENAETSAKVTSLASIKRNLIKSLIVASLVLSLEVMLYLATR